MKVQNLVVTSKYMKDGEEKKAYKNIGKVFTYDDGGQSVLIESMPVGNWDGRASIYDIKPREQQAPQQQPQRQEPRREEYQPQYREPQREQGRPPIEDERLPF